MFVSSRARRTVVFCWRARGWCNYLGPHIRTPSSTSECAFMYVRLSLFLSLSLSLSLSTIYIYVAWTFMYNATTCPAHQQGSSKSSAHCVPLQARAGTGWVSSFVGPGYMFSSVVPIQSIQLGCTLTGTMCLAGSHSNTSSID